MMKFTLPVAALLIAGASINAMAASVGTSTDATGAVSATTNNATAGATASAGASAGLNANLSDQSSFADVTSSLSMDAGASVDFSQIPLKHIKLVRISKLKGYTAGGLKLSAAGTQNMKTVQSKVAGNANLTAALKQSGYTPSDVVAISSDGKGEVVAFIDK